MTFSPTYSSGGYDITHTQPNDLQTYGPICKGSTLQIKLPKRWSYKELRFIFKKADKNQLNLSFLVQSRGLSNFPEDIGKGECNDSNGVHFNDGKTECSVVITSPKAIDTGDIGGCYKDPNNKEFNYINITNFGDGDMLLDFIAPGLRSANSSNDVYAAGCK
jgi:hypothetical protein